MAQAEKTLGSRIADVVVLLISLVILMLGFIAWKVYEAGPARNAYDVAVEAFNEAAAQVTEARDGAASVLDNCAERSGLADECAALQQAYDATATIAKPEAFGRITSKASYEKATEDLHAKRPP